LAKMANYFPRNAPDAFRTNFASFAANQDIWHQTASSLATLRRKRVPRN
jgi:hypothetical protein